MIIGITTPTIETGDDTLQVKHRETELISFTENLYEISKRSIATYSYSSKFSRHESIDAIPLIRKTKRYKSEGYSLDKGYDAERIHTVIREEAR